MSHLSLRAQIGVPLRASSQTSCFLPSRTQPGACRDNRFCLLKDNFSQTTSQSGTVPQLLLQNRVLVNLVGDFVGRNSDNVNQNAFEDARDYRVVTAHKDTCGPAHPGLNVRAWLLATRRKLGTERVGTKNK
eukprot:c19801_g1_i1.p1 GENE.c19801_g1_i1~~c19801_g1_i1.p1  ORF type:complete len:132 (-),score=8.34 c19801_g1_i1:102-497(-)